MCFANATLDRDQVVKESDVQFSIDIDERQKSMLELNVRRLKTSGVAVLNRS